MTEKERVLTQILLIISNEQLRHVAVEKIVAFIDKELKDEIQDTTTGRG